MHSKDLVTYLCEIMFENQRSFTHVQSKWAEEETHQFLFLREFEFFHESWSLDHLKN
jgi:hypothetical protein